MVEKNQKQNNTYFLIPESYVKFKFQPENNVLLKHRHAHLFTYCLAVFVLQQQS